MWIFSLGNFGQVDQQSVKAELNGHEFWEAGIEFQEAGTDFRLALDLPSHEGMSLWRNFWRQSEACGTRAGVLYTES